MSNVSQLSMYVRNWALVLLFTNTYLGTGRTDLYSLDLNLNVDWHLLCITTFRNARKLGPDLYPRAYAHAHMGHGADKKTFVF